MIVNDSETSACVSQLIRCNMTALGRGRSLLCESDFASTLRRKINIIENLPYNYAQSAKFSGKLYTIYKNTH